MNILDKSVQRLLDYPYAVLNDTALKALINLDMIKNAASDDVQGHFIDLSIDSDISLGPKECSLAFTEQYFDMPPYLSGQLSLKSKFARLFLDQINSVQIKAGWRGFLLLELVNHSEKSIKIKRGERIAQVFFTKVPPCEVSYHGNYQDQSK